MPDHIFISHSTKDDGFVKSLRKSLEKSKTDSVGRFTEVSSWR